MARTETGLPGRGAARVALGVAAGVVVVIGALIEGGDAPAREPARAAQAQTRPNIVLLETDDQTLESMRVMPNVRRLIGDAGVTFDTSLASYPLCCPSRATVLTGQYAHNHEVLSNVPPTGGYYKLDGANTLPAWLERAGYATVHLGKYLNGYGTRNRSDVPPGWTEWHGLVDPSTYDFYGYTFNDGGTLTTAGRAPGDYQTDVISARAQEIVRRRAAAAQPFFLWTAFLAPHSGRPREAGDPPMATPVAAPRHLHAFDAEPLPRPASFNETDVSDKPQSIRARRALAPRRIAQIQENYRQRLESLLAVDEAVAAIVGALAETGEIDNTLILFTSDNGFFHGEHRVPAGKVLLYEPSTRVPLLMRGPGVPRGVRLSQPVANIDLAATIVDAADARPARTLDGRSLLGLARDPAVEWGRDILLENGPAGSRPNVYKAVRTRRYVYARYGNGEQELYDLARDPHQLQSRHADPAMRRVRSSLSARLNRLSGCRGSRCRTRPRLALRLSYRRGRTGAGRTCAAGRVRAEVRGTDRRSVETVRFHVQGRRAATDGRSPFRASLRLGRVARGDFATIRARATVRYDRLLTLDRRVRRC